MQWFVTSDNFPAPCYVDFDDAVDEEDLDLIEENLGINLDRVSLSFCNISDL
jgi:hypothetical protein